MKIYIKELKGNEVSIEHVSDDTTIADIKKQIENKIGIPGRIKHLIRFQLNFMRLDILVAQQKLLYLGKILVDQSMIRDYKISENAKLMLTRATPPDLKKLVYNHFSRYFDSKLAETLSNQFVENSRKLVADSCSLDDLERLGEVLLRESP